MWGGEDNVEEDLLDLHTAAAYRYATTQPLPSGYGIENRKNGGGDGGSRSWGKESKPVDNSYSSVTKHKLANIFEKTTGKTVPRDKKKKRRKGGSATGGTGTALKSATVRPASPSVRAAAPGITANVSTRRVRTAHNDDIYHNDDGSKTASLEVIDTFDGSDMRHVEAMRTGILGAVPSYPKNKYTYVEKLGSVEEIMAAGTSFRKGVDLRASASQHQRELHTSKSPDWIDLRENYMRQLTQSARQIVQAYEAGEHSDDSDRGGNAAEHTVALSDANMRHLLLLLVALRKVTVRLVQEHEDLKERLAANPQSEALAEELKTVRDYLVDVPRSLTRFSRPPFAPLLGVESSLNPLLLPHHLDGSPAPPCEGVHRLNAALQMGESELRNTVNMSRVLHGLHCDAAQHPKRPFGHHTALGPLAGNHRHFEDMDSDEDDSALLLRNQEETKLLLVIQKTDEFLQMSSIPRTAKAYSLGLAPMREYWKTWRKAFVNSRKISEACVVRRARNRRLCFDRLVQNVWQSNKFRELQQNYTRRVVMICFGAWNEYKRWCKRFQSVYKRSTLHIKAMHMNAFKRFAAECFEVREFRRKQKQRMYSEVFTAFVRNSTLTKHELRRRLQSRSSLAFSDKHHLHCIFSRWNRRNNTIKRLDAAQALVEALELKQAFVQWVLSAYGPRSQRRARSVAKARVYMNTLRDSFESTARRSWSAIKGSLAAISPMPNASERAAAAAKEVERYEHSEARRRVRMQQALAYAQNTYGDEDLEQEPAPKYDGLYVGHRHHKHLPLTDADTHK